MAHKPYGALRAQMSPAAQAQADRQAQAALRAMPDPTPGAVAYAAYVRVHFGIYQLLADWQYGRLSAVEQASWEAAAQAVLALARPSIVPVEDPHLARLRGVVQEARPFVEAAFGAVLREIVVQVVHDAGSGDSLMRVVARVASNDTAYLDGLLRLFDETWWLANCHRSGGQLVFDYETIPAPATAPMRMGTAQLSTSPAARRPSP